MWRQRGGIERLLAGRWPGHGPDSSAGKMRGPRGRHRGHPVQALLVPGRGLCGRQGGGSSGQRLRPPSPPERQGRHLRGHAQQA